MLSMACGQESELRIEIKRACITRLKLLSRLILAAYVCQSGKIFYPDLKTKNAVCPAERHWGLGALRLPVFSLSK